MGAPRDASETTFNRAKCDHWGSSGLGTRDRVGAVALWLAAVARYGVNLIGMGCEPGVHSPSAMLASLGGQYCAVF